MRLRELQDPKDLLRKYPSKDLFIEQKFDGFKAMGSYGKYRTKLYSRNGNEFTKKAPEIVNALNRMLSSGTSVLGEIIYIRKGKQELHLVQSILHSKDPARAIRRSKELGGKLYYIIYDILEYKSKNVTQYPLEDRRKILRKVISVRDPIRISKTYSWNQKNEAMRKALAAGGEGIVIKLKSSPYHYRSAGKSEPHGDWWKYKPPGEKSHLDDVILLGYEKREKRFSFKMYQLYRGKRVFVGNISNLPRKTEREVKLLSDEKRPIVAEISYQERFPSGKFRHPGWVRLRPDKPIRSATLRRGRVMIKPKGRVRRKPKSNPRRSKVKDALAAEAIGYKKFEDFSRAYWDKCARGIYWYATDEKRFYIGGHEERLIKEGRFFVACSPDLALSGKNKDKKYVAELDVTGLSSNDIAMKRGSAGAEIKIIRKPKFIKVTRVLDAAQARRSFKWQLSILPSSQEELRKVWNVAWEKKEEREAREVLARRKKKEREEKRAEKREAEERRRKEKRVKELEKEHKRKKKEREKIGEEALKKRKKTKQGKWKRVPPKAASNPSTPVRSIPCQINKPGW